MTATEQVIIVTGASSGFGELSARSLARAGHVVYAGMRETSGRNSDKVDALRELAAAGHLHLQGIEMDVQSQESVDAAVRAVRASGAG